LQQLIAQFISFEFGQNDDFKLKIVYLRAAIKLDTIFQGIYLKLSKISLPMLSIICKPPGFLFFSRSKVLKKSHLSIKKSQKKIKKSQK